MRFLGTVDKVSLFTSCFSEMKDQHRAGDLPDAMRAAAQAAQDVPLLELGEGRFEIGVFSYGSHGERAAQDYIDILRAWDRHDGSMARIEVWPSGTPDADLPADRVRVLDKPHTHTVLAWT